MRYENHKYITGNSSGIKCMFCSERHDRPINNWMQRDSLGSCKSCHMQARMQNCGKHYIPTCPNETSGRRITTAIVKH